MVPILLLSIQAVALAFVDSLASEVYHMRWCVPAESLVEHNPEACGEYQDANRMRLRFQSKPIQSSSSIMLLMRRVSLMWVLPHASSPAEWWKGSELST